MAVSSTGSPETETLRSRASTTTSPNVIGPASPFRLAVAVDAPQHGVHARDELGGGEGLDDVVVGPEAEADDAVGLLAAGGQQDHRDVAHLAQSRHHLQAVEARQHHVEHDQVRPVLERRLHRRRAVRRRHGAEAVASQVARDDLRDGRLVVDHEDRLGERHASIVRRVGCARTAVFRGRFVRRP